MSWSDADPLPPHSVESERAVVGSLLLDRDTIVRVAPLLESADFFDRRHSLIYRAVLALYHKRVPADFVTIIEFLESHSQNGRDIVAESGGLPYLAELTDATPTSVHAEHYAGIVRDYAIRRRLIDAGTRIVRAGFDLSIDTPEAVSQASAAVADASPVRSGDGPKSARTIIERMWETLDEPPPDTLSTGMRDLDDVLGGMVPGQLIVPAGRPGMGKSAFAICVAYFNAVLRALPVGLVSLEMPDDAVMRRFLAIHTGMTTQMIRRSDQLNDHQRDVLMAGFDRVSSAPLYIDDCGGRSLPSLVARARNMHAQFGLKLLIVDYLQLIQDAGSSRSDNRTTEVGRISGALKELAMELRIPVLAPAQLNRNPEARQTKQPALSDLRESGAIEQDADVVLLLHRPEYYDPADRAGEADIAVAKNREGETRPVTLAWLGSTMRFANMAKPGVRGL